MTGRAGPISGTGGRPRKGVYGSPVSALPSISPIPRPSVPRAPGGLKTAGRKAWKTILQAGTWLDPERDCVIVEQVCQLVDDIAAARAEVEKHGLLLEEPIVTPRGDTVGVRQVLNPAEMAARRAGALLERLLAALGFSPAARSRLNIF